MQRQYKFPSDHIVPAGEDRHKLVSAGPVDRAVGENITDHPACLNDVFISCLVPQRVVDLFQTVHITDDNGKFTGGLFLNGSIVLLFAQHKRMLALYAGQRISESDGAGFIPLRGSLLLPLLHRLEIKQQNREGQAEQNHDGKNAGIVCVMKTFQLFCKEYFLILRKRFFISRTIHIAVDLIYDGCVPALIDALCPRHGHDDDKPQKSHPYDDGFTKSPGVIFPDDRVEKEQPQDRPDRHKGICLRLDGLVGENDREHKEHHKDQQDDHADAADQTVLSEFFLAGNLENSRRSKAVNDHSADGRSIHDPPDSRSSKERNRQGQDQDQKDRVDRDLFVVQLRVAFRKNVVLGSGIAKAADRAHHADQTGKDQCQK